MTVNVHRDEGNQWKRVQRLIAAKDNLDNNPNGARQTRLNEYNDALADLNKWIDKLVGSNALLKTALSLSDMADFDEEN